MRYWEKPQILFQEVPSEISLAFQITGCRKRCKDCHSPFLWVESGSVLTQDVLKSYIARYDSLISCVLFFGGEWWEQELIDLLKTCKEAGLHTCLYTGEETVSGELLEQLTYVKVGEYVKALGGLGSINTNQKFIRVSDGQIMNNEFRRLI